MKLDVLFFFFSQFYTKPECLYLHIPYSYSAKVQFQIWFWILLTCISCTVRSNNLELKKFHRWFSLFSSPVYLIMHWYCQEKRYVDHLNLLFAGYFGRTRATAYLKRDLLLVYSQVCLLQEKRGHMEGMCIIVLWWQNVEVSIPVTTRVRWGERLYFQCCIAKICFVLTYKLLDNINRTLYVITCLFTNVLWGKRTWRELCGLWTKTSTWNDGPSRRSSIAPRKLIFFDFCLVL